MGNRKPALGFIFVTILLDVIGFGIIIPVMPQLIQNLIGGTMSDASLYGGLLMFSFAMMQFVFSPIFGGLSDKYGRRPIILTSLFGFGLNYFLLAYAPTIEWLFLGRILAGVAGASLTTATAYIADISTPEKRAQNFGIIGAAFGLGFIIGPVIGGVLGQYHVRAPFIAAAIFTLINWMYGYFILPESLDVSLRRPFNWKRANPVGSLKHIRNYPILTGLAISFVLLNIAIHAVQSTWSYFVFEKFDWTQRMVGVSLGVVGVLVAFVQGFLIRKTTPLLGQNKSIYAGLMFYAIGLILFAFANSSWMMYVFLIPYCLGGIAGPAMQAVISNQVPANEQGELQGAMASLMSLTAVIGPLLMTNLFSLTTSDRNRFYFPGAPFALGAVLMVASLWFAHRTLERKHH
ncbi:MAG: TCR/Tet family MFS transporter [Bacteroidia bacterium]|nr:TCR/Tet family MFS transporter [Bacteroidia bacterium]